MRGSLVTEVLVQKQNNYLVKEVWEKHYSREQWNRLTSDEKQDFAYKELLSEMAEDMTGCLLRNILLKPLDEAKLGPKTYIVDFIHKLRGLNLIAIKEIDRLKGASGDLQIVEDYETLVSDKERSNIELKKRNVDLETQVKSMDQKISALRDAKQIMVGFEGLEREYKEMVGDLVGRLSEKDKTIEALTTKIVVIEKRHKDYRFLFGNVNNLQEKLIKMEKVYTEKLSKCFHHYSSTMTDVTKEARLMEVLVTKLRNEKIIATKASSQLAEIMHRVEAAVQNFERFTNKFTDLEEISDIVAHYIKAKNQTKMEINKLIYLQEFQKFGDEKKLKKGSTLKETFISNIDRIKEKYLPEAENTFSNPGKTAQEGKHEESTRDKEMTAEKTKFQGGSTGQQFFRTKTMSQQLQRPMRSSKTLASLTGKNAAQ